MPSVPALREPRQCVSVTHPISAFTIKLSALIDPADGHQIFTRMEKECIRLLKQKLQKCDVKLPREWNCCHLRCSVTLPLLTQCKSVTFRTRYAANIKTMSGFLRDMLRAHSRKHINQHLSILVSAVMSNTVVTFSPKCLCYTLTWWCSSTTVLSLYTHQYSNSYIILITHGYSIIKPLILF